jgi:hypothetical protein
VAEIRAQTYIAVFVKRPNLMITTEFIMCAGNVSGRRDGRLAEVTVTGDDILAKKSFGLHVKWPFDINPLRTRCVCVCVI